MAEGEGSVAESAFDLIVVGDGPGGYPAAIRGSQAVRGDNSLAQAREHRVA